MEEIRLTTWDVKTPANNGMKYLSSGAGFLPSTLCHARKVANMSIKLPHSFLFERPLRSVFWKWRRASDCKYKKGLQSLLLGTFFMNEFSAVNCNQTK